MQKRGRRHRRTQRAQLTVFIIIGILLIIVGGLAYVFLYRPIGTPTPAAQLSTTRTAMEGLLRSCLDSALFGGAHLIALQGGYIDVSGSATYGDPGETELAAEAGPAYRLTRGSAAAYGVALGENRVPSLAVIVEKLKRYTLVEVSRCATFESIKQQGYAVRTPDIDWQAVGFDTARASVPYSNKKVDLILVLTDNDIVATLTYPVQASVQEGTIAVDQVVASVPLRLALTHSTATRIADNIVAAINTGAIEYVLTPDCQSLASADRKVNIYVDPGLDPAIQVVDTSTVGVRGPPYTFQYGVNGISVEGRCDG
ncbi:MAG: hypothetical protein AABY13_03435 [Nanoarchaeota archaeon]